MDDKENDLLDSLMESLSDDQEIEQKIDTFARNKERSLRIARARQTSQQFQNTYSSTAKKQSETAAQQPVVEEQPADVTEQETDDLDIPEFMNAQQAGQASSTEPAEGTIQIQPRDLSAASGPDDGSGTRVFARSDDQTSSQGGSTVSVSDSEIKTLLEKDKPILSREYVSDDEEEDDDDVPEYRPPRRHHSSKKSDSWKKPAIIAGIMAAIALVAGGGWMMYSAFSHPRDTEQSASFDRLMKWVSDYSSLSEADQKKITDYKKMYDRLSEDEKRKVNEALMSATGKTFDELLAAATEQDKPQSSNQNIANAERKAQLKEQMSALRSEIDQLNSQFSSTQQRITDAENDYNAKNSAYQNAQAAADSAALAQSAYDQAKSTLDSLPSESSLNSQIDSIDSQIKKLQDDGDDDDSSRPDNSAQIADLQSRRQQLQDQLAQRQQLQDQLKNTPPDAAAAQQNAVNAKQAADTAYGAWQAILGDADPISQQIAAKTQQLDTLQQEYNSID